MDFQQQRQELAENGFSVAPGIYSPAEVQAILDAVAAADHTGETFRRSADLFAIRQLLKAVPEVFRLILNPPLRALIHQVMGEGDFVVKSIYFDKPGNSNWYVAWHQDLTISVDQRAAVPGFGFWTVKQGQYAVQPPLPYLEHITTLRIHLDDTDAGNGALYVVPGSHLREIYRPETIDWSREHEVCCDVPCGAVMLMKPLTLHRSPRASQNRNRRVIHIEFASMELPAPLQWAERIALS